MVMVLKLLNSVALKGWFIFGRETNTQERITKKGLSLYQKPYKRSQPQYQTASAQPLLSQRLYEEHNITSLTYADKLYKRLPNETMAEFHQRVLMMSQ